MGPVGVLWDGDGVPHRKDMGHPSDSGGKIAKSSVLKRLNLFNKEANDWYTLITKTKFSLKFRIQVFDNFSCESSG